MDSPHTGAFTHTQTHTHTRSNTRAHARAREREREITTTRTSFFQLSLTSRAPVMPNLCHTSRSARLMWTTSHASARPVHRLAQSKTK